VPIPEPGFQPASDEQVIEFQVDAFSLLRKIPPYIVVTN
jgi:hypothetical protein